MAELAPDPLIRKRYKMLLDLIFIDDAQMSVQGRRGGGRSRASYGENPWEMTKNIMYGDDIGVHFGSSHNKMFETSTYQVPASAVILRKIEFPREQPFEIINRVIGEYDDIHYPSDDHNHAYAIDGRLVNLAYRTPHYLIGGLLVNPSLSMKNREGKISRKYSGISVQKRWSGMLFHHPDTKIPKLGSPSSRNPDEMCAIYPDIEKTQEGRPQNSFWGIGNKNVWLHQRISPGKEMGSYSTGMISIRFHGKRLEKTEKDGWIFASDGKAFCAVKFVDGDYTWDNAKEEAKPKEFKLDDKTRYLMHAGDIQSHKSLEAFMTLVLGNGLEVKGDQVTYISKSENISLTMYTFDPANYKAFKMPLVNGKEPNLSPVWTYKSPYMNSAFKEKVVTVTVGPVKEVYDFRD